MKILRFDLYSGYESDRSFTEKDTFIQMEGDTLEDLAQRIYDMVIENGETLMGEDDSDDF